MKWDWDSFKRHFGLKAQNGSGDGDGPGGTSTSSADAAAAGFGGQGGDTGAPAGTSTTGTGGFGGFGGNVGFGGNAGNTSVGVNAGNANAAAGFGGGVGAHGGVSTAGVSGPGAAAGGGGGSGATGGGGGTASGGSGYGRGTVNALNQALASQMFGKGVQGMNPATVNLLIQAGLMGVPFGYATGVPTAVSPVAVSELGPPTKGNALSPAEQEVMAGMNPGQQMIMRGMLSGMASPGFANPPPGYMNMGFPAIEGVSPGLTAAPAGPSPGSGPGGQDGGPNAPSPFASNTANFGAPGAPRGTTGFQAPPGFAAMMSNNVAQNMGAAGSSTGTPGSYGAPTVGGAGVAHITQTPFQGGGHA
jgi:hypothetical protein